jgi:hypothetical protein
LVLGRARALEIGKAHVLHLPQCRWYIIACRPHRWCRSGLFGALTRQLRFDVPCHARQRTPSSAEALWPKAPLLRAHQSCTHARAHTAIFEFVVPLFSRTSFALTASRFACIDKRVCCAESTRSRRLCSTRPQSLGHTSLSQRGRRRMRRAGRAVVRKRSFGTGRRPPPE